MLLAGIQGEPPDTSNWPHLAALDGNPFVNSPPSATEIDQRDMVSQLGKTFFWDQQLSVDNTMACGTCHLPRAGGTDNRPDAVAPNGALGAFWMVPQAISPFGTIDAVDDHRQQLRSRVLERVGVPPVPLVISRRGGRASARP